MHRVFHHSLPLKIALVMIFLIASGISAWAQFDSAEVLGTVKDPSGSTVANATVQLTNLAKAITVTRKSDSGGDYDFTNVQAGDYSITVTAQGFEQEKTDKFIVTVGARQRVDLALKLGADTQSVTVTGAAAVLETETSDRGETVQGEEAVQLPLNGRAYADLAALVPGVHKAIIGYYSFPARDGSYDVNGLNSMDNNFQLDGIDNNAFCTRERVPTLPTVTIPNTLSAAPGLQLVRS